MKGRLRMAKRKTKPGPKPGTGGRPRAPEAAQRLRGTARAARQRKDAAKSKQLEVVVQRAAVPRASTIERRCRTLIPGYDPWHDCKGWHFDAARARKAIAFFHCQLSHVKGASAQQPFTLEPWQQAVIGNIFGWVNAEGMRRYREAFIFIPRKNGKTALAAGIILLLLFEEHEPMAEIYGAASEFGQASFVFYHARGMVLANPRLKGLCQITSGQSSRTIQLDDYSTYKVIASSAYSAHGMNTSGAVIDELHTLPNRDLVDVLQTSTGSRRQPLIVYITTSDFEREASICNEKHLLGSKIRDGLTSNPAFLPVIFEAAKDDDWHDEATWKRANPNLGVSLTMEYLREAHQRAVEVPGFAEAFKRLHLNIRTQSQVGWLRMEDWARCGEKPIDPEALLGRECWGGLDLATSSDLTALVLVFPDGEKDWDVLAWFWLPNDNIDKRGRSGERSTGDYRRWIEDGHITATEGNITDFQFVRHDIGEIAKRYAIRELAIDRLWQGDQLMLELQSDGLDVVIFGQGFMTMARPSKRFEDLVVGGRLHHGGNPVLRWMASNVVIEVDPAGCIKPNRARSTEKIDGIVATIMALGRAYMESPYESDRPAMAII